jgi:hypothetical protein
VLAQFVAPLFFATNVTALRISFMGLLYVLNTPFINFKSKLNQQHTNEWKNNQREENQ